MALLDLSENKVLDRVGRRKELDDWIHIANPN